MPEHVEGPSCGCWGCVEEAEARSRLLDSVTLLAQEHKRLVVIEDQPQVLTADQLLVQLAQALRPPGEAGGSSGTAGAPVDVAALDLVSMIERESAAWPWAKQRKTKATRPRRWTLTTSPWTS